MNANPHVGILPAIIIGLLLLALGFRLLFIAIYRKRKGDKPHCRKCDYQLTGLITEQTCCPECGNDLRTSKAVVKGSRFTHKPLLITAAVINFVALGLLISCGYQFHATNQWLKYKPTAWLINDAAKELNKTDHKNTKELIQRVSQFTLTDEQLQNLSQTTVALQIKNSTTWNKDPHWPGILDQLLEDKLLTQQQIQALIIQNHKLQLMIKPVMPRKQSFHCHTDEDTFEISKNLTFSYQRTHRQFTANDQRVQEFKPRKSYYKPGKSWGGTTGYSLDFDKPPFLTISDGPVRFAFSQHIKIRINTPTGYKTFEVTETDQKEIQIIAADALADTFSTDAKFDPLIENAWHRTRVESTPSKTKVWVELEAIPVNLAMQVVLLDQGNEHVVGHLLINEVLPKKWFMVSARRKLKLAKEISVLLRPSQDAANTQKNLDTYWGKPMQRDHITVNAPYSPEFVMDQTMAETFTKNIKIQLGVRHQNHSLSMHANFHELPVNIDYILMGNIGGKWRQIYYQPLQVPATKNYGFNFSTSRLFKGDQKTMTIRLLPNQDWEATTRDFNPPWGYAIEFKDLPIPAINEKISDKRYTGKVIFPVDTKDSK